MLTVPLEQALNDIADLTRRVEVVVLTREGRPVADLVPRAKPGGIDLEAGYRYLREQGLHDPFPYVPTISTRRFPRTSFSDPYPDVRLLLDTHILIGLSTGLLSSRYPSIASGLASGAHDTAASVVSLWGIAIRTRLGKLNPGMPLSNLAVFFETAGLSLLAIDRDHAVAEVWSEPLTRDPFDRLLLAQCKVEKRLLVSADTALVGHPVVASELQPSVSDHRKSENPPVAAPLRVNALHASAATSASRSAA